MKNIFLSILIILGISFCLQAQTTLIDYTKIDCDGVSQNLFTTLDQNNVVVLIYEHRCGSCTQGATNVKNVFNTYYSSYTNIKIWYLDNGGGSCAVVNGWISTNSFIPGPVFEYSSNNTSPYGSGMPQIVIAAGPGHTVFLNSTGPSNTTIIHNAIEAALTSIGVKETENTTTFEIYPNPVYSNSFNISYSNSKYAPELIEIYNLQGQLIKTQQITESFSGNNVFEINTYGVENGVYFVCLKTIEGSTFKRFVINK